MTADIENLPTGARVLFWNEAGDGELVAGVIVSLFEGTETYLIQSGETSFYVNMDDIEAVA